MQTLEYALFGLGFFASQVSAASDRRLRSSLYGQALVSISPYRTAWDALAIAGMLAGWALAGLLLLITDWWAALGLWFVCGLAGQVSGRLVQPIDLVPYVERTGHLVVTGLAALLWYGWAT